MSDFRAALAYKKELYPEESEVIAEAHFKLSLALEFASITKSSDDDSKDQKDTVDQSLRDEAAVELEAAIASTKLKLSTKEVELATLHNPEDNDLSRQQIAETKEVIADMEQRLIELRKPPIDINSALGLPPPKAQQEMKVSEEVTKNANDLTGLVRKKRKVEEVSAATPGSAEAEGGVEAKKVKEAETN